MAKVHEHILQPEFKDIPKGWGQVVFWRAYNDLKKSDIRFAQIPEGWINKGFSKKGLILSANNGRCKEVTAKKYSQMIKKG